MTVLLFTKTDSWSRRAREAARAAFGDRLQVFEGSRHNSPPVVSPPAGSTILLSFLSPWILPPALLDAARLALNFHPGNANYPGIGAYNFALYEGADEYGAVCHHMAARVDTGAIVIERNFAVDPEERVETLKLKTMGVMLEMFEEIVGQLARGLEPSEAPIAWRRRPFTRRELETLCQLTPAMDEEEMRRRIRAVAYPGFPGARIEIAGTTFHAEAPPGPALA